MIETKLRKEISDKIIYLQNFLVQHIADGYYYRKNTTKEGRIFVSHVFVSKVYHDSKGEKKIRYVSYRQTDFPPEIHIYNVYEVNCDYEACDALLRQRIINEEDFLKIEPWAYSMKGVFAEGIKNLLDGTQSHAMWSGNVILKNVNLSIGTIKMAFQEIKAHSY